MPHNPSSIISVSCLVLLIACAGSEAPPPKRGSCEFTNATVEPYQGVPAQLEICIPELEESRCNNTKLRSLVDSMPTTRHEFTAGATCDALGYTGCDPALPFPYCRGGEPLPPPPFAATPSQPGPAYIAVRDHIAVILPDGTAQVVADATGSVSELALGADGEVYAVTTVSDRLVVWKLAGATATKVGSFRSSVASALAVAKDGTVYLAQYDDVFSLAPGAKSPTKLPAPSEKFIHDLSFDADGRLVAASGAIAVWNGTGWDVKPIPGLASYHDAFALGLGESLVVGGKGVGFFTLRGGELVPLLEEQPDLDKAAVSPNGTIAYIELGDTHLLDRKGGTATSQATPDSSSAIVIDDTARLWYAAYGGLTVRSLVSDASTTYPIGTLPALTGLGSWSPDGRIVVVGAGPSRLPPVEPARVVDQVTGILIVEGEPVVGETVEICTSAASLFQGSPCAADASRMTTTTNDQGEFVFAAVPVGHYNLAVSWGSQWVVTDAYIDLDAPAPLRSFGKLRYGAPE